MENLLTLSTDAAGVDDHAEADKRQEFRELKGRIKELRETNKVLASRLRTLEARRTELAAELGASHPSK